MIDLNSILHRVTKPARYTGGEWNMVAKDWESTPIRIALVYPDTYEIGMSNMALPILYDILNSQPDVLAERAFAPWTDMEVLMRQSGIALFSLENKRALRDFDVIGFSLGYELTYTNVLNMMDLAGIPVLASERDDSHPLIVAGGSCTLNPEPMADFIDLFVVGDGEEVTPELVECLRHWKVQKGRSKADFLRQAAELPGVYVPAFYHIDYLADGRVKKIAPVVPEASKTIKRRLVSQLPPPVVKPVVPYIEVIHDRGAIEIQRGCSHGCRFCQAGSIYRPVRERRPHEVVEAAGEIIANCGYNEVSLVSLSTSDYPAVADLVVDLAARYPDTALSLPSLNVSSFSMELMDALPAHHRTGLTFAVEAGSERLRCAINKNVPEDRLLAIAAAAFQKGWTNFKLYFMLGLPGETLEDVQGIVTLVDRIRALGSPDFSRGKTPQIRVNASTFVPKPHTPFQWVAQASEAELGAKHEILKKGLQRKGVRLSWSDPRVSQLEAALSRGDRRLGKVIYSAWKSGCTFDSWSERFDYARWLQAFAEARLEPAFYSHRERPLNEVLPWSHIDGGVTTAFLKEEFRRARESLETTDCRTGDCSACGLQRWDAGCLKKMKASRSS